MVAGQTFQTSTDFILARYNNDGSPDNTFSGDGKQTTDINSSEDIAKSVAIQSDGKIIIAGIPGMVVLINLRWFAIILMELPTIHLMETESK